MISRHISIAPEHDNYARLARYIAGEEKGRAPSIMWCVGGMGSDDYKETIREAADVQRMHTRSEKSKSYHLIVSFRPEDEHLLTPKILREIERRFADCLGLADHQRHCAVHTDTENMHLHVAYNLIHPERYTRHEPFGDFDKRDALCRALEKEYGLRIDNGKDRDRSGRVNEKARAVEKHQGKQSFASYVEEHKPAIMDGLKAAETWQDAHRLLKQYGLALRAKANGFALVNTHGNHGLKASALDRSISKGNLVKRFGEFQQPDPDLAASELARYSGKPIQRSPACEALRAECDRYIEARIEGLEALKERQKADIDAIRAKWAVKHDEVAALSIHKRNRRSLAQFARQKEKEEIAAVRLSHYTERDQYHADNPYLDWPQFLIQQAELGNRAALGVLRAREEHFGPDANKPAPAHENDRPVIPYREMLELRADYAGKNMTVVADTDLANHNRNRLKAYLRMDEVVKELRLKTPDKELMDPARRVTKKGTVIFELAGGGVVRDAGQEINFSPLDETAVKLAEEYARKKWGTRTISDRGRIVFDSREPEKATSLPGPDSPGSGHTPDEGRPATLPEEKRRSKGLSR